MPNLPNPWYLLGSVALTIAAFFFGSSHGKQVANTECQLKLDKISLRVADMNEVARATEVQHAEQINQFAIKLSKAQTDAKNVHDTVGSSLRSGALRLSVPTSTGFGLQPPKGATFAGGGLDQARAYLDPETAQSLVAITKDGDDAIRQLNTCIDSYNLIRGQVNATE
jgi:prophage endopeptidase